MGQKPKDTATVRRILAGHGDGLSIRKLARTYSMSPTTVSRYVRIARAAGLTVGEINSLSDMQLSRRLETPGTVNRRRGDFMARLPLFRRQISRGMPVIRMWNLYRDNNPDGYSLTQFSHYIAAEIVDKAVPETKPDTATDT